MLKKYLKICCEFLSPVVFFWSAFFYMWWSSHFASKLNSWFVVMFLFVPLIIYELWRYCVCLKISKKVLYSRFVFWLFIYGFIYFILSGPLNQLQFFLQFSLRYILINIYGLLIADYYLFALLFFIWLVLYFLIVFKKKKLELLVVFLVPVIFFNITLQHFYYYGGMGKISEKKINSQPGVKLFYDKYDFPKKDYFHYRKWHKRARLFPRNIYIDQVENALYGVYANTLGLEYKQKVPTILKIDLNTRESVYFNNYYVRDLEATQKGFLTSPWFNKEIYELDKKNLSVLRQFKLKNDVYPWKVREIFYYSKTKNIYVVNDMQPRLYKYSYDTGELLGEVQFDIFNKYGTVELWLLQYSSKMDKIYLAVQSARDIDVVEVDPVEMKISRTLDLDVFELTAMTVNDESRRLYCQDGGSRKLYEVDLDNFSILRVLQGETHARKILVDIQKNCLYLLGYIYGRIVAVDLETGHRLWTKRVGAKAYGMVRNAEKIYVNSQSGIVELDLAEIWSQVRNE